MDSAAVTLFIDRDTWSHKLDTALRAASIPFEAFRQHFRQDAEDVEWLPKVAQAKWVVVTRDQNIRRRANEIAAVREGGLHLFALTSGNLSAAETGELVVAAWPRIRSAVAATPPPAFWSITRGGEVRRLKR